MTNREILAALHKAKDLYIRAWMPDYETVWGLCYPLKRTLGVFYSDHIVDIIPEFYKVANAFGGTNVGLHDHYWWDEDKFDDDRENPKNPRIRVLNRLIQIYESK